MLKYNTQTGKWLNSLWKAHQGLEITDTLLSKLVISQLFKIFSIDVLKFQSKKKKKALGFNLAWRLEFPPEEVQQGPYQKAELSLAIFSKWLPKGAAR